MLAFRRGHVLLAVTVWHSAAPYTTSLHHHTRDYAHVQQVHCTSPLSPSPYPAIPLAWHIMFPDSHGPRHNHVTPTLLCNWFTIFFFSLGCWSLDVNGFRWPNSICSSLFLVPSILPACQVNFEQKVDLTQCEAVVAWEGSLWRCGSWKTCLLWW